LRAVLAGCVLVALQAPVRADGPALDPRTLGVNESLLHYCEPLDAADAARLREKIKQMVKGTSDAKLAAMRASAEYRKGYDAETQFVALFDEHNVRRACSGGVRAK